MSPAAKAAKAQKSFEAFALQTFIGSMLPKENSKMFGTGNAGKMWQSLLAEKLADQITASGRLKLLPQQPSGTPAASAATGTPSGPGPTDVTAPASATAVPEGTKRLDAAGEHDAGGAAADCRQSEAGPERGSTIDVCAHVSTNRKRRRHRSRTIRCCRRIHR